ncbi:MAG: Hsp20 family protein, partial [Candidatus Diapherotrites archaeon]
MRRTILDEIREMQSRMDELFEEFFRSEPFASRRLLGYSNLPVEHDFNTPLADFWETDKDFRAELDLPGVSKGDVKVNVSKGLLEVKAEKKHEEKKDVKGVHHYE